MHFDLVATLAFYIPSDSSVVAKHQLCSLPLAWGKQQAKDSMKKQERARGHWQQKRGPPPNYQHVASQQS